MHNIITGKCHPPIQFTEEQLEQMRERKRQRKEGRARVKKEQEAQPKFNIREYLTADQLRHRNFILQGHNARRTMQDMDFGKVEERCLAAMAHESNLEELPTYMLSEKEKAYTYARMIASISAEKFQEMFNSSFIKTMNDTEQDWW